MKSFVDPRSCKSVYNHFCWIRFEGSEEPLSIDVPLGVARSHHYRNMCPKGVDICKELEASQSVDDIMQRYKRELDAKVSTVLRALGKL